MFGWYGPYPGFGGMGFGWRRGWRWGGGNPYPFCRAFPWLPRGWRWMYWRYPFYPYY